MPRRRTTLRSQIAKHERRADIEQAIAAGVPYRRIAERFGVTIGAVKRHKAHLARETPQILAACSAAAWAVRPEELEKLRVETADGWLRQIRMHHAKLVAAFDRLVAAGNDAIAAQVSGQVLRALEMLGRAVGEIATHSVKVEASLVVNPAYWRTRTAIIQALAPYPDARAAVIAALKRVEAEPDDRPVLDLLPERRDNRTSFAPKPVPRNGHDDPPGP